MGHFLYVAFSMFTRPGTGGIYLAVALLFDVNVSTGGAQSPGRWIHRKKPQFVKGWMIHWKNPEKPWLIFLRYPGILGNPKR